MIMNRTHFTKWPAFSALTTFFWLVAFAGAQSVPAQNPARDSDDNRSAQDRNADGQELARFDQFLDTHREIAEQVRKDPSLQNDERFVKNHPALHTYLLDHPGIRAQIRNDADAFMNRENRYDRREENGLAGDHDITRRELARFDQFLDNHREIARQLRNNPSLVNDQQFVKEHPALEATCRITRRLVRRSRKIQMPLCANNPAASRADRDADNRQNEMRRGERDVNRDEMARFDRFLDTHRETAEQLRHNPSLVNDRQFLNEHPALQTYLRDHPRVRSEISSDPNAFIQQQVEAHYDRRDDFAGRQDSMIRGDRDAHVASFREFLGQHSNVAEQLSKDPTLASNRDYLQRHPELQSYLNAHPEVRQELMANPQAFVKSTQQLNNDGQPVKTGQSTSTTQPGKTPASPTADPSKPRP